MNCGQVAVRACVLSSSSCALPPEMDLYSIYTHDQDCTAATRIYVQDPVRDAFVERFLCLVATLVVGAKHIQK
jgi:hypothetical protein